MSDVSRCPVCAGDRLERLVTLADLPTLPNAVCESAVEAQGMPRGELALELCTACGHLFNSSFDPACLNYDARYENSLHFSATFQEWITSHAHDLVGRYHLAGGLAAELGAGSGDFLDLLCQAGMAEGRGYDPSYSANRVAAVENPNVTMRAEYFPTDGSVQAELIASRHVLEHLEAPVEVATSISGALAEGGVTYHEVPNGDLMVRDLALWDLIYEHVSYFTQSSLRELCRLAGLSPKSVTAHFGEQFLAVEAVRDPSVVDVEPVTATSTELNAARAFGEQVSSQIDRCRAELTSAFAQGPVVLWGAGSKGTSYLNLVDVDAAAAGAIDLNPRKHGTFVAGTPHRISGPEALSEIDPATVLVANPIYLEEITEQVHQTHPKANVAPIW